MSLTTQALLDLYDAEIRRNPPPGDGDCEILPGLVRCVNGPGSPWGGWIIYTHLQEGNVEAAIQEQITFFRRDGRGFEWKVYEHDTPAGLKERLATHGFEVGEAEALVVLDLADAPSRLLEPPRAALQRITDPAGLDAVLSISHGPGEQGIPGLKAELAATLRNSPDLLSIYLATVDGVPASSAWIRYEAGRQFAGLWGGATRPEFRGRGLYTALVAARAQEARARGVRFLTVDASPMSRPILERLGFRFLVYTYPCVWNG